MKLRRIAQLGGSAGCFGPAAHLLLGAIFSGFGGSGGFGRFGGFGGFGFGGFGLN